MKFAIGVDVGTTNVKAVVMDSSGKVGKFASTKSKIYIYNNNVEQNPEEIWNSVVKVIRAVTKSPHIRKGIAGISLSTQGGTLIPVDKNNNPIRQAITWMDRRAMAEGKELINRFGEKFFYYTTGWIPENVCLCLPQVIWLKRKEKNTFKKIAKYHFIDSFLIRRLTGKDSTDPTNAAISMLCDIRAGNWSKKLLEIAGIDEKQLPQITPSGKVIGRLTEGSSRCLGLPSSVLVYSGGHDQYCSAFGAKAVKVGHVLLSAGTAWAVLAITDKPVFSLKHRFSPGPHVVDGLWGTLSPISCGGKSLDWFLENILSGKLSYKEVNHKVGKILKDPVPVFRPTITNNEGGAFTGIRLNHSIPHFLKSIMEGLAIEVNNRLRQMKEAGIKIGSIKMIGGGAKSSVWPQIVSRITGLPVSLPDINEVASIGAAMLVTKNWRMKKANQYV